MLAKFLIYLLKKPQVKAALVEIIQPLVQETCRAYLQIPSVSRTQLLREESRYWRSQGHFPIKHPLIKMMKNARATFIRKFQ